MKGTLIALGIFTFLGSWNDLFWPLIVLSDRNHLTLPAGLAILGQGNYQQRGITVAAVIASLPPLASKQVMSLPAQCRSLVCRH